MAQVQRRTSQRVQNDRSAPLPSFEMPWVEAVDPDRTLKRPALRVVPMLPPPPNANGTEEICAEDVLEVLKVADATPPAPPSVTALQNRVCPNPRITVVPEVSVAPKPNPWLAPPSPVAPPPPWENRADPARLAEPERGSVAPVAFENINARSRAESTFMLEDTPYGFRMPRMGLAIAGGLGAMIGIFVLVFALGSAGAKPVVQAGQHAVAAPATATATAAATATPPAQPASEAPRSSVPTIDIASLPQAHVGSVSLAKNVTGHRLFVDGSVVSSGSAVVSCGKHLAKVGSKGRKQEIDVPCGTDVAVGY